MVFRKQVEKCWCGEHHIDICKIHGSQPFYHDEGASWEIYRCIQCERVHDSFADGEHVPHANYWETLPIRAMVVLADVLIQDSVSGSMVFRKITGVSTPDDSFLLSPNKFEMNKVIIPKVESIPHAKGYRTHLKKVANRVGQKDLFGELV